MPNRIFIGFLSLFLLSGILQPLSAQTDPWDMNLDAIIDGNEKDSTTKLEEKSGVQWRWTLDLENKFSGHLPGKSLMNPDDMFPLDLGEDLQNLGFSGNLTFPYGFQMKYNFFGAISYGRNEDVWDSKPEFEVNAREFYLMYHPQWARWLTMETGRENITLGNSYAFNIFNSCLYNKNPLKAYDDSQTVGTNLIGIGVLGSAADLFLFYVPGYSGDTPDWLQLKNVHSLNVRSNIYIHRLVIGLYLYGDSDLNWQTGLGLSVDVGRNVILYSDLSMESEKTRRLGESEIQVMGYPYTEETINTVNCFRGTLLGINLSFDHFPDMISELYFNSGGNTSSEWDRYKNLLQSMGSFDYRSSPLGTYYMEVLGSELNLYNPFNSARWLLYLRIYENFGKDDNQQLGVNSFVSPADGSALISPQWKGSYKSWSWTLSLNFFVGAQDSLFGMIPNVGQGSLYVKYSFSGAVGR